MWPLGRRRLDALPKEPSGVAKERTGSQRSVWYFVRWLGPALMVSIAYMDPGNYGTDLVAGAGYRYDLLWAVWLASGMAMLMQYLSGKLGIASGYSLPELVRQSLGKKMYVVPYWLAAEAAAAATDLAEYLGTVIALNLLFGVPLLYASIFGALDVLLLLTLMNRRFRLIEQYFLLLIGVLVVGILYNLVAVKPSLSQIAIHSIVPIASSTGALMIVVGVVGATVMPHALFVHSWLTKNKMDLLGRNLNGSSPDATISDSISGTARGRNRTPPRSSADLQGPRRAHLKETVICLAIASAINAGILLVAIPLYPNPNITIQGFVNGIETIFGPAIGVIFVLSLLASGLSSSALGTIAGQIIMEGLIGKHGSVWSRRVVTRIINVFPTTIAVLIGLNPLSLLVYSQVILSLMIPLPMIPIVYYTSKRKFVGDLVNRKITIVLAVVTVCLILGFNLYYLASAI